jgi:hypothetical protein
LFDVEHDWDGGQAEARRWPKLQWATTKREKQMRQQHIQRVIP